MREKNNFPEKNPFSQAYHSFRLLWHSEKLRFPSICFPLHEGIYSSLSHSRPWESLTSCPSSDQETGIEKVVFQEREGLIPAGSGSSPRKSTAIPGKLGNEFLIKLYSCSFPVLSPPFPPSHRNFMHNSKETCHFPRKYSHGTSIPRTWGEGGSRNSGTYLQAWYSSMLWRDELLMLGWGRNREVTGN